MSAKPLNKFGRFTQSATTYLLIVAMGIQPLLVSQAQAAPAVPPNNGLLNLFNAPYLAGQGIPPYVMLTMTKDQQLFKKAYDDYSDLDEDGKLDTTYKHSINYYGYFDSSKCYSYSDSNRRFEPASVTPDKYCNSTGTGQWSGNFLNWSSMTRMDALRKVLFGGLRSPNRTADGGDGASLNDGDADTTTVLERAYLPTDAHAFSKYYAGSDLKKLTPYDVPVIERDNVAVVNGNNWGTNQNIDSTDKVVRLPYDTQNLNDFEVKDIVEISYTIGGSKKFVRGVIAARSGSVEGKLYLRISNISALSSSPFTVGGVQVSNTTNAPWSLANLSRKGLTICNTTDGATSGPQSLSNTNTNLPRMKVIPGNYSLWNASERWQCTWSDQRWASNNNRYQYSGIPAYDTSPARGSNLDYFVRVSVCVNGLIGQEKCKKYPQPSPAGTLKPVGLLQTFGENDQIRFGLMTGSFQRNLSGGVLRKNIGKITDEIDSTTGKFIALGDEGVGASVSPGNPSFNVSGGSIIKLLGSLRMMGYYYNDGTLFNSSNDASVSGTNDPCTYQTELNVNGKCKSWGNPISEIYHETLRYFGGQTAPTSAYDADDTTVRADLVKAQWPTDPKAVLSENNYCAPLNALVINGATSTNENDNQINALDFMSGTPGTAVQLTNQAGAQFGLAGNYYFGNRASDATNSAGFRSCTSKALTGLGDVVGICPEGPTYGGTFLIAGLAYHAHTNTVNKALAETPSVAASINAVSRKRAPLKVDTYTVSLSSGVPSIPIKFAGEETIQATLQPAYRLVKNPRPMGGALVDVRVLSQTQTLNRSTGKLMVSWEDSEGGGDYDMDVWGTIEYELVRSAEQPTPILRVTTTAVSEATVGQQGFGYIVSGTNADGQHFHSGIENFAFNETTLGMNVTPVGTVVTANGSCVSCNIGDGPSTATYQIVANGTGNNLREPLWYAAVFGGFDNNDNLNAPGSETNFAKFDKVNNATGAGDPDGVPDNFFKVANPGGLEVSLTRAFQSIAAQSSLTNVASATTRVKADNRIYEAKFNSGDWSGQVTARKTDAAGLFLPTQSWDTNTYMANVDQDARTVLTMNTQNRQGTAFRWQYLSSDQKSLLNLNAANQTDTLGKKRLEYLRGSDQLEGLGANDFRPRTETKLGSIINSNPVYVGKPNGGNLTDGYATFAATSRTPMVYVGANDGMLHGFDAETGQEKLAFVPSSVYNRLAYLTRQEFLTQHRYTVDGQISTYDVYMNSAWKTFLVGGLGNGAQGVYALDVTNPSNFTEGNASSIVKWEFTDRDDPALGFVHGEPLIRRLKNGRYAALVTSGYNATAQDGYAAATGTGHLFVLFLEGPTGPDKNWVEGSDYVKIPLGSDAIDTPSHVGPVSTWDSESNGAVDYAYMGDYKGRMWRVKFDSNSPSGWTSSAQLIFTATAPDGSVQPITTAPMLTNGPLYQGAMVIFGTGTLMQWSDLQTQNYKVNSMYGVLDRFNRTTPIPKSELMAQKSYASTDISGTNFSLLSAYIPNYTDVTRTNVVWGDKANATGPTETTNPQHGWRFEMLNSATDGERNLFTPIISGDLLVFANAIPSSIACDGGGDETRYTLSVLTGGRYWKGGFDTNGDKNISLADTNNFNNFAPSGAGGTASKFFASRRLKKGGYGQINALEKVDKTASTADGICIRALAYSTAGDQPEVLPGGCVNRVQWRESLNLSK